MHWSASCNNHYLFEHGTLQTVLLKARHHCACCKRNGAQMCVCVCVRCTLCMCNYEMVIIMSQGYCKSLWTVGSASCLSLSSVRGNCHSCKREFQAHFEATHNLFVALHVEMNMIIICCWAWLGESAFANGLKSQQKDTMLHCFQWPFAKWRWHFPVAQRDP